MKKKKIFSLILVIIFGLFFVAVASYLLILANGYKINLQAKKIQKTGMIYLKSDPKDVEIYLDGKLINSKIPARISYLLPRRYTAEVKKLGFSNWSKTMNIESGQVAVCQNIVLFKNNPDLALANKEEIAALENGLKNDSNELGLKIKDGEIWWGDDLITRMSDPIKKVSFWNDKNHILFQIKNEIRIMDLDATNNIKLVELTNDQASNWLTQNSGKYLIYQDAEIVKKAEIK